MNMWKDCRRTVIIKLLAICVAVGAFSQSALAAAEKDVLSLVPSESLFAIRVNSLDYTLGEIDKFITGISPVPMGLRMIVRAQLAEGLGSPELAGLDMNGDIAVFGIAGEANYDGSPPTVYFGVLVPVSDFEKFVSGNANIGDPDGNGIISMPPKTDDDSESWLVGMKAGNHVLFTLGQWYEPLLSYKEFLSQADDKWADMPSMAVAFDADNLKESKSKPIWMYGDVQKVTEAFGSFLEDKYEEVKAEITENMKNNPSGPAIDPTPFIELYKGIIEMFLTQTDYVTVMLEPKADVLRISEKVAAVPGSDLAGMLVKDIKPGDKLRTVKVDGAAVSFTGFIGESWKHTYDKLFDALPALMGDSVDAESMEDMRKLTAESIDMLGGPVTGWFSLLPDTTPPFTVKYIVKVNDEKKFKELVERETEVFSKSGFGDIYKSLGIKLGYEIKQGGDSYKGTSIDTARLSMESTDGDSEIGKVINALYGGGFDYRWAVKDGHALVAVGGKADAAIRQMIDESGSLTQPGSGDAEMKDALALMPGWETADFLVTYNYVRILNMVGPIMKSMQPDAPMPTINVPTKSNIVIAGWGGKDQATFSVAIPKQHVMELVGAFMQMQQTQQQQHKRRAGW